MKRLFLIMTFACSAAAATSALAADRRIARIDGVVATQKHGVIVIHANGAVQTGGWKTPRLHVIHNDGHTITVEFLASAPPPGMTVIEALVPVTVIAEIKTQDSVASVHAIADANEITAQVLH